VAIVPETRDQVRTPGALRACVEHESRPDHERWIFVAILPVCFDVVHPGLIDAVGGHLRGATLVESIAHQLAAQEHGSRSETVLNPEEEMQAVPGNRVITGRSACTDARFPRHHGLWK